MDKIPVIGTAVVNSSYWVNRLLMSIDYPVRTFVIINNNGRNQLTEDLDNLCKTKHRYVDEIKVVHMPANIGCGGAWNLIIKCYMNDPMWLIVNDDVAFKPGLLAEMMQKLKDDPSIEMMHPNGGDFGIGSWDLFLMKDIVVRKFGLFDENTYPAYCEDADYLLRFAYAPINKNVGSAIGYLHGTGTQEEYYTKASQTSKTDETLKKKLENSNALNIEYLTKKWGQGWRMVNPTQLPFQNEPHHISEVRYDLDFVRSKHLGF